MMPPHNTCSSPLGLLSLPLTCMVIKFRACTPTVTAVGALAALIISQAPLPHPTPAGHGRSAGTHGLVRNVDALVADVVAIASELPRPLFLFGQSLGGLLALRAAASLPTLAGIVLQAPTVALHAHVVPTPAAQRALALFASVAPALPAVPPTAASSYHPAVMGARLAEDGRDPLVYSRRLRLGTGAAVINAVGALAADVAAGALATLRTPVLLQHGDADTVCDVAGSRALAAALPAAQLEVVPGGHHDLLREREGVARATLASATRWMASRI